MKLSKEIIEKAERVGVSDKIDWKRVKQFKREPGKRIRNATEANDLIILGSGDLNKFKEQPLAVIPLNDYLAQLKSMVK